MFLFYFFVSFLVISWSRALSWTFSWQCSLLHMATKKIEREKCEKWCEKCCEKMCETIFLWEIVRKKLREEFLASFFPQIFSHFYSFSCTFSPKFLAGLWSRAELQRRENADWPPCSAAWSHMLPNLTIRSWDQSHDPFMRFAINGSWDLFALHFLMSSYSRETSVA